MNITKTWVIRTFFITFGIIIILAIFAGSMGIPTRGFILTSYVVGALLFALYIVATKNEDGLTWGEAIKTAFAETALAWGLGAADLVRRWFGS